MISLPIDDLLPSIVATLKETPSLVLEAPPGAGKTTRVPSALLDAGFSEVLVLEPRRIAARMAARRVADERGEAPGRTVGYQVRFESVASESTRLRFLTEGVLTRRLLSDPDLRGVSVVVLDEFHERHLEGDLALALLRRLQQTRRPDLKLVVMSATLRGEPIAEFLGGCPVLRSEGRLFPLEVEHTPHSAETLETRVRTAVERLIATQAEGDILVFLPGAAEIRRAERELGGLAQRRDLLVLPLHGDLSPDEQDRAVAPTSRRKVILSTNVAESSITIDGVRAVVDSGLARVATDSPWTGLPRVELARVSRASSTQRAGRAGRTAPGHVIRLYAQDDFLRRPESDAPEITRRELAQLCLDLHAAGLPHPSKIDWLDAPPSQAVEAAEDLLYRLGALSEEGRITPEGKRMALLPLHPRMAKLALEADARGAGEDGVRLAALLSAGERLPEQPPHPSPSDALLLLEQRPSERAKRVVQQLMRAVRPRTRGGSDDALLMAVLAAFPDRVARRVSAGQLKLSNGASGVLTRNSAVHDRMLVVALDIEERPDQGLPIVRMASAIEPEWLLDLFPDRVKDRAGVEWNRQAERVESVSALLYDEIVIDESRSHTPDPEQAAALLAERAIESGLERFTDAEALELLKARIAFASENDSFPALTGDALNLALRSLCFGLKSFSELKQAASGGALEQAIVLALGADAARRLDRIAPERMQLPSGRRAKIGYAPGQAPWVASRLQDFFGMTETPRVANGRVPLVVHLLAPNQRPVQMTTDLAGFWQRLYPQVRKELMRRYPRHAWPENPLAPQA